MRSPAEYHKAHIPNALSLPLFTNEQRVQIGTEYKQINRQTAVKTGLGFFKDEMLTMIEKVEKDFPLSSNPKIIVHCWRGGMRSGAVAWLLSLYGYEVYTIIGGYKSYRTWALQQFEKDYHCKVIGGYTGTGKTPILHLLAQKGYPVLDLEKIANHRGSAFGKNDTPQQSQEMFENLLAMNLHLLGNQSFWVEDESRRIGDHNMPHLFWNLMKTQPVYFIEKPFEERLEHILSEYGKESKEKFEQGIIRIQKRLGPLETKTALAHLANDEWKECFAILLKYYDKYYYKSLQSKPDIEHQLIKIEVENSSDEDIIKLLLK